MRAIFCVLLTNVYCLVFAQFPTDPDSIRGSLNQYRSWWDVTGYSITVRPDFNSRSIVGSTQIFFDAVESGSKIQVDLQEPLIVDSVSILFERSEMDKRFDQLAIERKGNIFLVTIPEKLLAGDIGVLSVDYHGVPREAVNPPWDGGWIWKTDRNGNPWMSVACQGLGASVWYPCKDHQSDEPDTGAELHIQVPDTLVAVGNGRLVEVMPFADGTTMYSWSVENPINNYNIIPYIGKYERISDSLSGADGNLDLDYWVLEGNKEKAKKHFDVVKPMMHCFEDWFGPYPFYEDGFKLVESPHLGMEHQSAVAYGNAYKMGYLGRDLSGTGVGLKFDYIIVHESGHEWFGNNITTADIADMWVHEGFTAYTETVFAQCMYGKELASDYIVGTRRSVQDDKPIIGKYGVNKEGSGDMYYKGANMIHMIRFYMGDEVFKKALRDMNHQFRHGIVTSAQIESFLNDRIDMDLSMIFDQYLRERDTPVLEYKIENKRVHMRFRKCKDDFTLPIHLRLDGTDMVLNATRDWTVIDQKVGKNPKFEVERDLFVRVKEVPAGRQ